ncbi:MAG: poly(A) polymerase [Solirubrobacterales bacterium]|nr:poly(A) polymerase [Solirubrobacterales bacterium]
MAETLADRLAGAAAVRAARQAIDDASDVWIVGGAARDALEERPIFDLDLATARPPESLARSIAAATPAAVFQLSEEFASWRVAARDGRWQIDVSALRGESIEADLALRDFTVNAIAMPLAGGEPLDPHAGAADLEAGVLRAVGERCFADDPLRLMRAARIGAAFGLAPDAATRALARSHAGRAAEPAGERQLAELRGILTGPDPLRGLELLADLAIEAVVLPELEALRGVEQNPYHHLDVHGHTLAVLEQAIELERPQRLAELFPDSADELTALLAEPLADELTRAGALRFAALFHDLGKPATRSLTDEGRVTFIGHDRVGAEIIAAICRRLRTSRRLRSHLEGLTMNHLRVGFLVHARPLERRQVYEFLRATDPAPVDLTLLTVADRLATQGPKTKPEALEAHLGLARELLPDALAWQAGGGPGSPLSGDELSEELELEPGPQLGRLLEELSAAAYAGEITSREDAIALARRIAGP